MQQTKDTLENLVTSYFTTKIESQPHTDKDYFFIHISPDNNELFPIKTAIPIKVVENYSKATVDQKNNFNNKLEKSIKNHIKNFSGDTESWPIDFDITH